MCASRGKVIYLCRPGYRIQGPRYTGSSIKHGFHQEDVVRLVPKSFDVEQQQLCSKLKYNPSTKLVEVQGSGDMDTDISPQPEGKDVLWTH